MFRRHHPDAAFILRRPRLPGKSGRIRRTTDRKTRLWLRYFKLSRAYPDWDCLNTAGTPWQNPFNNEIHYETVPQLMATAREDALKLIGVYADMYVRGSIHFVQLNRNFDGEEGDATN